MGYAPVPLYYKVQKAIEDEIENGTLKPGNPIPTEEELQKKFRVSRTTIRTAIENLVRKGLLRKEHGRGTFVLGKKLVRITDRVSSFTHDVLAQGLTPSTRVLTLKRIESTDALRKIFSLNEDENIIQFDRLRFADQEPIAILYTYLPEWVVPGFVDKEMGEESLYDCLSREYGIKIHSADDVVEAALPTIEEARLLSIDKFTAVLSVKRTTVNSQGIPVEFVHGVFRSDRWLYHAKLRHSES